MKQTHISNQTRNIKQMKPIPLDERTNLRFVTAATILLIVIYNELAPEPMTFISTLLLLAFAGIGSFLPKIDDEMSIVSYLLIKYMPFLYPNMNRTTQRDQTHSISAIALLIMFTLILQLFTGFSIFTEIMRDITVGYVLYLVQTSFSKTGILWLSPFKHWDIDPITHVASQKRMLPDWILYKEGGKEEEKIGTISRTLFIFLAFYCFLQIAIFPLFNYSPF